MINRALENFSVSVSKTFNKYSLQIINIISIINTNINKYERVKNDHRSEFSNLSNWKEEA